MIRLSILAALSFVALAPAQAQTDLDASLDRVLAGVVGRDARVNYRLLGSSYREDLNEALATIAAQDPAALRSDDQKTAFLINAYNLNVLARVLATPRAQNIERQGLFETLFQQPVRVAGRTLTLNQLEHGVLRRQSRVDGASVPRSLAVLRPSRVDYRIHAALNCAAVSCPPLQRRAYRAGSLDRDLDAVFGAFASSSRAARIRGQGLILSSLFDWFATDFEADGRPLGDVILAAASGESAALRSRLAGRTAADLKADRSVRFVYDWSVNRK